MDEGVDPLLVDLGQPAQPAQALDIQADQQIPQQQGRVEDVGIAESLRRGVCRDSAVTSTRPRLLQVFRKAAQDVRRVAPITGV